jgi:hypothetical protein
MRSIITSLPLLLLIVIMSKWSDIKVQPEGWCGTPYPPSNPPAITGAPSAPPAPTHGGIAPVHQPHAHEPNHNTLGSGQTVQLDHQPVLLK